MLRPPHPYAIGQRPDEEMCDECAGDFNCHLLVSLRKQPYHKPRSSLGLKHSRQPYFIVLIRQPCSFALCFISRGGRFAWISAKRVFAAVFPRSAAIAYQ